MKLTEKIVNLFKPLFARLDNWKHRAIIILASMMFIGGIIFYGLFGVALDATNTTEFCTSCHTMQTNLEEMKHRVHYSNASGVTAGCADCHVPHSLAPKLWAKVMAAKDVWHEILGTINTKEKYEEHRWGMANAVWAKMKATDSRECQECHSFDSMDFNSQSRSAAKQHRRIKEARDEVAALNYPPPEVLKVAEETCIDCHKGIAHEEPVNPEDVEEEEDLEEKTTTSSETEKPSTPPASPIPVAKPQIIDDPNAKDVIPAEIDANWDGATLSEKMCEVCHGLDGNSSYETVPSIAGYSSFYFITTIMDYKEGNRPSEKFQAKGYKATDMKTITEQLNDDQIESLANYFEGQGFEVRPQYFDAKLAKKGKKVYNRNCKKCHSDNGREPSDDAGILAGQSMSYMKSQLGYFNEGTRTQPDKMAAAFKKLKEGDINKLLHFFAQHDMPIVVSQPVDEPAQPVTPAVVPEPVVSVEAAKAAKEAAAAKAAEEAAAAKAKEIAGKAKGLDGAKLAQENCESCHGSDGNSQYEQVPNIAGLSGFYLIETMKDYKNGDRPSEKFQAEGHDETDMKAVTKQLNDAELIAIANYFANQEFATRVQNFDANLAKQGERVYISSCKTCHADNGSDPSDDAGILAGQSMSYLKSQFSYFKDGTRVQENKMAKAFKNLKDDDLDKLLHFFAQPETPVGPYDYSKLIFPSKADLEEASAEAKAKIEMAGMRKAAYQLDGAKLAEENCQVCHGSDGNSSYDEVPNIAALSSSYMIETVKDYKTGERPSETIKVEGSEETNMKAVVQNISEIEMIAIASYFEGQTFQPKQQTFDAKLAQQGKIIYKRNCKTCHADNGSDPSDDAGILAGQSMFYMKKQLSYFKDGTRVQEDKMAKAFKNLKDGDLDKLLHFFAQYDEEIVSDAIPYKPKSSVIEKWDAPTLVKAKCEVCHGKDGNSHYENVPNIAGLSSFYFTSTMKDYRNGNRPSEMFQAEGHDETNMKVVTEQLSDAALDVLADYFATQKFESRAQNFDADLAKQGKRVYIGSCKTCHADNGRDPSDDAGILAGQSMSYLKSQLSYFKDGTRVQEDKMAKAFKNLKEGDLDKLLHFFAQPETPVGPYDYSKLIHRSDADIAEAKAEAKAKEYLDKLRQAAEKLDGAKLVKENCQVCHGSDGNSRYEQVPSIAGLSSFYLIDAVKAYKTGERPSETVKVEALEETNMKAVTQNISEIELIAIANYFEGQTFEPRQQSFDANLAQQGKIVYKRNCKTCHSDNGSDPSDDAGILAGQSMLYLKKQLSYYKEGTRVQEDKMAKAFKKLKEGDIDKLLHFFAQQQ